MTSAMLVLLVAPAGLCIAPYSAEGDQLPACLMEPLHDSIPLPDMGLTRASLPGEDFDEPCEAVPADAWVRRPSSQGALFVHADGPAGSGRYWDVTVGIGEGNQAQPQRGACLRSSTIGWRTLQRYPIPLEWNADPNGDGEPELVLWSSFPLIEEAMPGEFGIIAWVYQLDTDAVLGIDWSLNRTLALEIARSYRADLDQGERLRQLRSRAAQALEDFGRGMCVSG